MSTVDRVVIVGGGLAGAKAAEALREQGYAGALTLVGAEDELPYQRPPLSKGYLAGTEPWEKALVLTREWYDAHDVELRLGVRADAIDPATHEVRLADGSSLGYDRLVLATGSTPRTLPVPGATAVIGALRVEWAGFDGAAIIGVGGQSAATDVRPVPIIAPSG